ncbi:hypothetical protein [Streptomyces flavidovirens]|uniref:hypothetical protein n=1 Tax=Streptomyces flavidovirens TaxID=67298 RepID=UPI0036B90934
MVEGEKRSRPTDGAREGGTREPMAVPRARNPVVGPPERDNGLPGLLGSLGEHLLRHAPEDLVILVRAEMERRELQAYANGWRDAADQYEPALEQARRIAQTRRLRLVGRTPGQAAVIPFPQDEQHEPESADAERGAPGGAPEGVSGGRTEPVGEPVTPGLVAKSRTSKVPTIPPLPAHRRKRREQP